MFNTNGQLGDAGVRTTKIVYRQEDEWWLGYLEEFPGYWTQGETLKDLEERLRDLHADLTSGELSGVRRVADLTLA
ncbi:type II toxin-antitoxin system HicB family antitoxin [Candidatus Poriferisodalis sp.]|uniref:type II toxin-antitoxin system HicB family antitoxin n=1 Tax=Candidatus Poriferisodalis sp. TaxID=3101277 RepID=UPI003AF72A86